MIRFLQKFFGKTYDENEFKKFLGKIDYLYKQYPKILAAKSTILQRINSSSVEDFSRLVKELGEIVKEGKELPDNKREFSYIYWLEKELGVLLNSKDEILRRVQSTFPRLLSHYADIFSELEDIRGKLKAIKKRIAYERLILMRLNKYLANSIKSGRFSIEVVEMLKNKYFSDKGVFTKNEQELNNLYKEIEQILKIVQNLERAIIEKLGIKNKYLAFPTIRMPSLVKLGVTAITFFVILNATLDLDKSFDLINNVYAEQEYRAGKNIANDMYKMIKDFKWYQGIKNGSLKEYTLRRIKVYEGREFLFEATILRNPQTNGIGIRIKFYPNPANKYSFTLYKSGVYTTVVEDGTKFDSYMSLRVVYVNNEPQSEFSFTENEEENDKGMSVLQFVLFGKKESEATTPTPNLPIIKKAPNFELPEYTGRAIIPLQGLIAKKKIVILNFWGTWCNPCIEEIPVLNEVSKKYSGQGVVFLGVTNEFEGSVSSINLFMKQSGINFNYIITYGTSKYSVEEVEKKYDISVYPTTILIDKNGNIRKIILGKIKPGQLEPLIEPLLRE